ncbi:3,4-dihydroxy-2-butanone-4-phosphate synthase [Acaricomes phytoseiuli]|uniref:3,4-dihydroxy-2-butanone-4-phosphate synthase n=1 Tax=Acaricomes phytoseiuli TaxID=291968 RepID=UPI00036E59D9|nr:3,4-dihydroxy-2-butanone-4-phosphate synthase [Acaricomes phytoseiuli]
MKTQRLIDGFPADQPPAGPAEARDERIRLALAALAAGGAVLVLDDEDREDEGDIVFAAELSTPELMGWTIRYSSGVICIPMPEPLADRLGLPPMVADNQDAKGTAYTVSCDAVSVLRTGISATDRSITARVLADPASTVSDLSRPGHIFPLRAVEGCVRQRRGHTEAAVELVRLAGCAPVAVIAELVRDDGEMMRRAEIREFGIAQGCPVLSIAELVDYLDRRQEQELMEVLR